MGRAMRITHFSQIRTMLFRLIIGFSMMVPILSGQESISSPATRSPSVELHSAKRAPSNPAGNGSAFFFDRTKEPQDQMKDSTGNSVATADYPVLAKVIANSGALISGTVFTSANRFPAAGRSIGPSRRSLGNLPM